MQTKRQYAISLGLATEGRGRLSREAHAAIDAAIAQGMKFADPVINKSAPSPVVKSVKSEEIEAHEISEAPIRFSINTRFKGQDKDGKDFILSAKECCRTCGYSFTSHTCDDAKGLAPSGVFVLVEPM